MSIEDGTKEYVLKKPILVHFSGEGEKEIFSLSLREPKYEHAKEAYRLQQLAFLAIQNVTKQQSTVGVETKPLHESDTEKMELDAEEIAISIKLALKTSDNVDMGDFVKKFVQMACNTAKSPIVMCDGIVPLKQAHIEQIPLPELLNLAVVWCSFFNSPFDDLI